jgi:integrase
MGQSKARRGTVAIEDFQGMLRLRWSYQGKRHCITLGMPNSIVNQTVAQSKAKVIEGDMVTGNFDSTLRKYKPRVGTQKPGERITITELLYRFIDHKGKRIQGRSLEKYKLLPPLVMKFLGDKPASTITESAADDFRIHLAKTLAPITQRERLIAISACWKWGVKQGLVAENPWRDVVKAVKVPPVQKPRPFSGEEIRIILTGFRADRYYRHYADFVEFLFSTGCRIGEAIALKWKHLSDDCSKVWIGESVSRGKVRKATKTNKSRQFRLTPRLQEMLLNRRPVDWQGDNLVFPAPRGGLMDDHLFCSRAWSKTLNKLAVEYRHPYSCRHTFICHALDMGVKPMAIAEMTGHEPQVLFKHYASSINGGAELPDLFSP